MRIKVIYLGVTRYKAGKGEEEYELPEGASVKDLLTEVSKHHTLLKDLISSVSDNPIDPPLIVALNGSAINPTNVSHTALKDGDTLALMTVIGGG
ncbi:MAG: MoaD/ThiS family protein [Candidatus Bathyarchaeia archaeon]|nr:MoaD/ThiS family protein [Candidatus Bathyarchaeota archaeon]